jgi:hypothetical protein
LCRLRKKEETLKRELSRLKSNERHHARELVCIERVERELKRELLFTIRRENEIERELTRGVCHCEKREGREKGCGEHACPQGNLYGGFERNFEEVCPCKKCSDSTIIPFSTSAPTLVSTHQSGLSHLAASLAFPGHRTVDVTNGVISPPECLPYSFAVCRDGRVCAIEGSFSSETPIHLPLNTKTVPYLVLAVARKGENVFKIIPETKACAACPLIGGTTYLSNLTETIARRDINVKVCAGDRVALMGGVELTYDYKTCSHCNEAPVSLELQFNAGVCIG